MIRYSVELTDAAFAAIRDHARHIAVTDHAPETAKRWLERVWDAVDSLEHSPRRAAKAQEDAYVAYEVRQLVVGNHLLLFTVELCLRIKRGPGKPVDLHRGQLAPVGAGHRD